MKSLLKKNLARASLTARVLRKQLGKLAGLNDNDNMIDYYEQAAPSPQTALDIFTEEWMSKLPDGWKDNKFTAGPNALFEDPKVEWFINTIGGVDNKTVLELGPMEAAHTYMLEKNGAKSVLGIEANTRAYLKCLIIKEVFELNRSQFLCGNFMEYLRDNKDTFDIVLASGVLYHMSNPAELIEHSSRTADTIFIWTHYYDDDRIKNNDTIAHRFNEGTAANQSGFKHTLYRHEYDTHLFVNKTFLGGEKHYSSWITKEEIVSCLKHFGFSSVEINFDHPDNPSGPCFAVTARK